MLFNVKVIGVSYGLVDQVGCFFVCNNAYCVPFVALLIRHDEGMVGRWWWSSLIQNLDFLGKAEL